MSLGLLNMDLNISCGRLTCYIMCGGHILTIKNLRTITSGNLGTVIKPIDKIACKDVVFSV